MCMFPGDPLILFLEERFNNSMTGLFAKHNACILAASKGRNTLKDTGAKQKDVC